MSDQTYLTAAYICMIGALALWTWTVFARSNSLQQKIDSLEKHSQKMMQAPKKVQKKMSDEVEIWTSAENFV